MSDLTKDLMRKALKELRKHEVKGNLKFISPLPKGKLPENFLKMLPSGTEIIYNEPIEQYETPLKWVNKKENL